MFRPSNIPRNPAYLFTYIDNGTEIKPSGLAKVLGVTLNTKLDFSEFVTKKLQVCNMHLRNLRNVKEALPQKVKIQLVTQIIFTTLDYCNVLLITAPQYVTQRLQVIMNNAVRFITGLKRREHISEFLFKLHILPINFRIRFKAALIAHKIVNKSAPEYLGNIFPTFVPTTTISLRTACGRDTLMLNTSSKHSPLYAQLVEEWNSLPYYLRASLRTTEFKKQLKTFYFKKAFPQFM